MESEAIARINLAVDGILQRCANRVHPDSIDDALTELRQSGWIAGEVDLVRSIVDRVIQERESS